MGRNGKTIRRAERGEGKKPRQQERKGGRGNVKADLAMLRRK